MVAVDSETGIFCSRPSIGDAATTWASTFLNVHLRRGQLGGSRNAAWLIIMLANIALIVCNAGRAGSASDGLCKFSRLSLTAALLPHSEGNWASFCFSLSIYVTSLRSDLCQWSRKFLHHSSVRAVLLRIHCQAPVILNGKSGRKMDGWIDSRSREVVSVFCL